MQDKYFSFEIEKVCPVTGARAGIFHTPHGDIKTPVFMPVGTQATVKGLRPTDLDEMGAQIILSNTYHLFLRPGHEIVKEAGGLHKFMDYNKPILTDSGGFQVFSLSDLRKVSPDGVEFRSHLSGEKFMMTPELCMEVQEALDSDINMALDQCTEAGATREEAENHPKKNMLMKALGCTPYVEPDVTTKGFLKGDKLVLTSDGLTNMVTNQEIYDLVTNDVENATTKLVELANNRGGYDNITVVIVYND